jgi:hypothetical protein
LAATDCVLEHTNTVVLAATYYNLVGHK